MSTTKSRNIELINLMLKELESINSERLNDQKPLTLSEEQEKKCEHNNIIHLHAEAYKCEDCKRILIDP